MSTRRLEQVRRLADEGYALETVASDDAVVNARFRRGDHVVVVQLRVEDARALLHRKTRLLPQAGQSVQ